MTATVSRHRKPAPVATPRDSATTLNRSDVQVDIDGLFPRNGATTVGPPPSEIEIAFIQRWIREIAIWRKTPNTTRSSYGLKHDVEKWSVTLGETFAQVDRHGREWSDTRHYVGNGAFIVAMQREGYTATRCSPGSPNAFFNASYEHAPSEQPRRAA